MAKTKRATNSEMKVLEFLLPQEKKSLFMLISTCLPPEFCRAGVGPSGANNYEESIPREYTMTWSYEVLCTFSNVLGISESYIEMYLPLVFVRRREGYTDAERIDNLSKSFDKEVAALGCNKRTVLVEVMALLMVEGKYDARGRVLCRNLSRCLHLFPLDFQIAEYYFRLFFVEVAAEEAMKKEGKPTSKMVRYAKVGLASVGAGAVIALTGGLAAPAIAGALFLTLGSTTIAAAATTTTIGALFGGAGAGLTGYKMMRRTRGVEEFEFEQYEGSGQLAMVIMVSGWIEESEDYKRSFGIPSEQMDFEELLTRYYQEHCPEKLLNVDKEIAQYKSLSDEGKELLFETLHEVYGVDPKRRENLVPAFAAPVGADELEFHDTFIQAIQRVFRLRDTTAPAHSSSSRAKCEHMPVPTSAQIKETCVAKKQGNLRSSANSSAMMESGKKGFDTHGTSDLGENEQAGIAIKACHSFDDTEDAPRVDENHSSASDEERARDPELESELNIDAETGRITSKKYWHWRHTDNSDSLELYVLRWETELQLELGGCIRQMVTDLQTAAVQKAVATVFFSALASAVMLPALLLKLTDVIDSLWTIASERADAAGVELADALLSRPIGSKPVTLVGYSMGARLIFSCLKELSRRLKDLEGHPHSSLQSDSNDDLGNFDGDEGCVLDDMEYNSAADVGAGASSVDNRFEGKKAPPAQQTKKDVTFFSSLFKSKSASVAEKEQSPHDCNAKSNTTGVKSKKTDVLRIRSLIEDVVLLGVPVSATSKTWAAARGIVCGRLINGYSKDDLVLSILYRFQRVKKDVGGIAPISDIPGIENIDLSDIVKKHSDYCRNMQEIFATISLGK